MKALIIILIVYINYTIANDKKSSMKQYPKKVKPYGNGKILINSGYVMPIQSTTSKGYTVFQSIGMPKNVGGYPELTFFSSNKQNLNQKTRVKKVLPDFMWSIRKKRSAEGADAPKNIKENSTQSLDTKTEDKVELKSDDKAITKAVNDTEKESKENIKRVGDIKPVNTSNHVKGQLESVKPDDKKETENKKEVKVTTEAAKKVNSTVVRNGLFTEAGPHGRTTKKKNRLLPLKNSRHKTKKGKGPRRGKSNNVTAKGNLKVERRLTGAREALIEDYPYVISILKDDEHWCSGALLNQRLAITTANCVWKSSSLSRMSVRAGSKHTSHGGQLADIQEVRKHPGWGLRRGPDHDVALILLDRNLRFSHSCHGVDLPNRVMMPPFDDVWVTSWGADRRDGIFDTLSSTLQVYHARLMDHGECNNVTRRFGVEVTDNFICITQSGRTAPCTRDTGAPAVSDGILWGLASWGIRKLCGTERYPAMFSYLASHDNMDFIANATHYLMADERVYPFHDRYPGDPLPKPVYEGAPPSH